MLFLATKPVAWEAKRAARVAFLDDDYVSKMYICMKLDTQLAEDWKVRRKSKHKLTFLRHLVSSCSRVSDCIMFLYSAFG